MTERTRTDCHLCKQLTQSALETVDHALKYAATDIDSLINLHNRIYGHVPDWPPWRWQGSVPELTPVIPNLAAYDARLAQGRRACMLSAEITACCKELKLSHNIVEMAETVQADSHQEYLLKLLRSELAHRETQRKDKFLKNAGFYSFKAFDGFRFDEVTLPAAVSPDYLRNCEFINTKTNLVMYGNVGTGKTFLSIALASKPVKKELKRDSSGRPLW